MKGKHLVPALGSVLVSVLLPLFALSMKDDRIVAGASGVPPATPQSFTVDAARINSSAQRTQGADVCSGVSFAQPPASPVFGGLAAPISEAVGDFNLDGKPDLVVANFGSEEVTILLGDGSGGFTQPAGSPIATGITPTSVRIGDFNLDGRPDIAVANRGSENVAILLGNGSGGFTVGFVFTGTFPESLAIADFNVDGNPDLAVGNPSDNNVTILLGNGSGGFSQSAGSPVSTGANPQYVTAGDFNVDGKPDLAVANLISNDVTILLGDGGGGFSQPAGSSIAVGNFPGELAVGDFNQDGKLDLATANLLSDDVTILLGNGSGGFSEPAGSPVGAGDIPVSVAAGDFNLDGKPDLAVANYGSNNVKVLLGNGSGGFTQPAGSPVAAEGNPTAVAVGDFNLDGKPDLAVTNILSHNLTIQLNTCDALPCPGIGFTQPAGSPVAAGVAPVSVAVGDFNLDGKPDFAVPNQNSNNVTILLGNGGGGFAEAAGSPVGAGTAPQHAAVADYNLDGKPDLAVANDTSGNVTVLLGNGSGGFTNAAGLPVAAGAGPRCIATADFNRDGKPDLAVANVNSSSVTILLGDGSGGFTQPAGSPIVSEGNPIFLAVEDFNLDGKADLAIANFLANHVTILLGDGSGGFSQPAGSPLGVGDHPGSIAVGDINLDGQPDVAVSNADSDNVTILLGDGSGGFVQPGGSPVVAGDFPRSALLADFDQDGKPDLAVVDSNTSNVTILLGDGSGGFTQPAGSPLVGAGHGQGTVGDFNLDAKPDLAVPSFNNVTILLNTCGSTPCTAIVCPANITAVTANVGDPCSVVNFPPPTSDNCPGATIVCNPPSGSCFPVGATTVTCTATNASGATATCAFTVTVFNARLQDDSAGCNNSVLFNTITGDYRWCCQGTIFTGRAKVSRLSNTFTLVHNTADRRVLIKLAAGNSPPSGTASLQSPAGTIRCVITDRNTSNDTCVCGEIEIPPKG